MASNAVRIAMKLWPILCFVILLRTEIGVADVYESVYHPDAKAFGNRVCTNKPCTMFSGKYMLNQDEKVRPCDDFRTYACGNYKYRTFPKKKRIGKQLQQLLAAPISPDDKPLHAQTKLYYQKCIAQPADPSIVKSTILSLINELGGWPLLDPSWTEFQSSWEEYVADIHRKYNLEVLIGFDIAPPPGNKYDPSINSIGVQPAMFADFPSRDTIRNAALFLGADESSLDEIDAFLTNIEAKRLPLLEQLFMTRELDVNVDSLGNLARTMTNFTIDKYIRRLLHEIVPVSDATIVLIGRPWYFKVIHELASDKRMFANYAMSIVASHLLGYALEDSRERSDRCLQTVRNEFAYPAIQIYAEKYYDIDAIVPKVKEMIKFLSEVLHEKITNSVWLDSSTRSTALKKLALMKSAIGYQDNLYDETYLNKVYNFPPPDVTESFIDIAVRVRQSTIVQKLKKVNQMMNLNEWSPFQLEAWYTPETNVITITLAILTIGPFHPDVPNYVNYAAIGMFLGHEISHGYDPLGRKYDEHGIMRDWWSDATSREFDKKAQCYKDQYDKEGIDGTLTVGENIADNVGMLIAYEAYKKLASTFDVPEPAMPGFERATIDQMFFLVMANVS